MYAGDTEFEGNRLLCAVLNNGSEEIIIKEGEAYTGPSFIDDILIYYATMTDVLLISQHVKFREYLDLNVLVKVMENISTYEKGFGGLENLVVRNGVKTRSDGDNPWKYKKLDMATYALPKNRWYLIEHCKEDTAATYETAKLYLGRATPDQLALAKRLQARNQPWLEIAKQCAYFDVEYVQGLVKPERLMPTLEEAGINCFYMDDEDSVRVKGSKKMHKDLYAVQEVLEKFNIPTKMKPSKAHYAKKGVLREFHWRDLYDLTKSEEDSQVKDVATLLYIAGIAHISQDRTTFLKDKIHPFEMCCAQSSGRVSHMGCPVTAGSIFRCGVIPPEGYMTYVIDASAEEMVIAAMMSGDEKLQKAIDNYDIYSYLWWIVSGAPEYVKLDKNDPRRNYMKILALGSMLYGGGPNVAKKAVGGTQGFSKLVVDKLHRAFPVYHNFQKMVETSARSLHRMESYIDKFPIYVSDDVEPNPLQLTNHIIQGTGCDLLRSWVAMLVQRGWTPFATLHDGVYIYLPLGTDTSEIEKATVELFNKEFPLWPGKSWAFEGVKFYGHLIEKSDYWMHMHRLTGRPRSELIREEIDFCIKRGAPKVDVENQFKKVLSTVLEEERGG